MMALLLDYQFYEHIRKSEAGRHMGEEMIADLLTGFLGFTSGIAVWVNVARLIRDKEVKGVTISTGLFFAISATWTSTFYFSLGQILAGTGVTTLALANWFWVALAMIYQCNK